MVHVIEWNITQIVDSKKNFRSGFKVLQRSHKLAEAITLTSHMWLLLHWIAWIDTIESRFLRDTTKEEIKPNQFFIVHFIACAYSTNKAQTHRHGIWFSSLLLGHCCWLFVVVVIAWSLSILFIECLLVNSGKWWMYATNARIRQREREK